MGIGVGVNVCVAALLAVGVEVAVSVATELARASDCDCETVASDTVLMAVGGTAELSATLPANLLAKAALSTDETRSRRNQSGGCIAPQSRIAKISAAATNKERRAANSPDSFSQGNKTLTAPVSIGEPSASTNPNFVTRCERCSQLSSCVSSIGSSNAAR